MHLITKSYSPLYQNYKIIDQLMHGQLIQKKWSKYSAQVDNPRYQTP